MEKIKTFLDFYRYPYQIKDHQIEIKINKKQMVTLVVSDDGIENIEDKLLSLNPLSGGMEYAVKKAFTIQSIGLGVGWIILTLLQSFNLPVFDVTYLLICGVSYFMLWCGFYLIKLEAFKIKLNAWLAE